MTLVPNTVTDAQQVASLRLRMEKTAFAWAQTTTTEQRATVAAFRNAIHARFISAADKARARKQFYEACQGENEKVLDFYGHIQHLAGRLENINKDVVRGKFEGRLYFEIKGMMEVYNYTILNEVIQTAKACE